MCQGDVEINFHKNEPGYQGENQPHYNILRHLCP